MKKRVLFLVLVLTLVIAACAPQPAQSQQTSPNEAAPSQAPVSKTQPTDTVELQLTIQGNETQVKLLEKWIPVFEEQNPGVKVNFSVLDWSNGKTQIMTSFAGGAAPDVSMAYSGDMVQYIDLGGYTPLDGDFTPDDFMQTSLDMATWQGKVYGLPWNLKAHAYYYRTDMYEEAGLDPEKPAATWDELKEYASKLTKRDASGNLEQVGLWIITSHPYKTLAQYSDYLWSGGGRFFSEDGCKAEFNKPEGVAAAQLLSDLLNVYKVDTPGSVQVENTDFAQGKVASLNSNNAARGILDSAPDVVPFVGIASTPVREAGMKSYVQAGGNYLGISSTTKHREEAVKLLLFLTTTPELVQEYSVAEFGPPALHAANTQEFMDSIPFMERWVNQLNENGKGLPQHPAWAQIQDTLNIALDQIYLQQRDPQEALDEAAEKVDAILTEKGCAVGW